MVQPLLILLALLLTAGPARADQAPATTQPAPEEPAPSPAPPESAAPGEGSAVEGYLQQGTQHFQAQRYLEAAQDLEKAYALDKRPVFLFNIAQAYRRAGHTRDALTDYKRFLEADPKTQLRAETEGYIQELTALLDAQVRAEREERERRRPVYKKGWFWGIVAGTVVLVGVGLGVGLGLGLQPKDLPSDGGVFMVHF